MIIKRRFDAQVRVGYTKTELVEQLDDLQHELVREALRLTGLCRQVEIGTMGDIPSTGSGLGSSSTVTVGLLNAIHTYLGQPQNLETLARQACQIEIDVLGKPIGKQDQYIAAYGGLRLIRFLPDEQVIVERIDLPQEEQIRFCQQLMLFYTNSARLSSTILTEQSANIHDRPDVLREMRAQAYQGRDLLLAGDFEEFGYLMHQGWELKKRMASKITSPAIDEMYAAARGAGALGGKIAGEAEGASCSSSALWTGSGESDLP